MNRVKPLGRVVYAFNPSNHFLEGIAIPSGPRSVLLSYWYLKSDKDGKQLKRWWDYVTRDYTLFVDSGVHSFKAKATISTTKTAYHALLPVDKDSIELPSEVLEDMDAYVDKFLNYAEAHYDHFDWVFEMDCDEFTSIEKADQYYNQMVERIGPDKIIRVWHSTRTFEDWKRWCEDPTIKYLSIEGGVQHSRNPDFYDKFVRYAHKYGKKVHVLALTTKNFLKQVNIDTTDSSTFINGGRFASVKVPGVGDVIFSQLTFAKNEEIEDPFDQDTKPSAAMRMHYSKLSKEQLANCVAWFEENGYTLEDVLSKATLGAHIRSTLNILYFDKVVDKEYREQMKKRTII